MCCRRMAPHPDDLSNNLNCAEHRRPHMWAAMLVMAWAHQAQEGEAYLQMTAAAKLISAAPR